jgi:hypothetical protein
MLRFLSSLFKAESTGALAPQKQLGIDLRVIAGALIVEQEYPRPQWDVIRKWVKENVAAEDVPIAWNEVGLSWLLNLKNQLGTPYSVLQSPNFWLLTARRILPTDSRHCHKAKYPQSLSRRNYSYLETANQRKPASDWCWRKKPKERRAQSTLTSARVTSTC